ncbi:MAG: flagellin, partial [Burkholderiales bacterium]|nr:flagellin [Burkholderiales bacterium]
MIINHNLAGANAIRNANANSLTASKSMQKLSSGLRINNASDDAAGLAISEKMRGQIRGLDQASSNAQDAISMTQTGEGALNETQSILQRMRELATQSANDTNVTVDRTAIQKEMNQLTSEINRIGNTTEFNTQKLLDGGTGGEWEAKTTGTATAAATTTGTGVITLKVDGTNVTASIASSADIASIVTQINTAAGTSIASLDANGKLVLESKKGDASGSIQVVGLSGTAATDLKIAKGDKVAATKVDLAASITGTATAAATTTGTGVITFEI